MAVKTEVAVVVGVVTVTGPSGAAAAELAVWHFAAAVVKLVYVVPVFSNEGEAANLKSFQQASPISANLLGRWFQKVALSSLVRSLSYCFTCKSSVLVAAVVA